MGKNSAVSINVPILPHLVTNRPNQGNANIKTRQQACYTIVLVITILSSSGQHGIRTKPTAGRRWCGDACHRNQHWRSCNAQSKWGRQSWPHPSTACLPIHSSRMQRPNSTLPPLQTLSPPSNTGFGAQTQALART